MFRRRRLCSGGVSLLASLPVRITMKHHLLIPLPRQDVLGKWKRAVSADGETEMDEQRFEPNGSHEASV